MSRSTTVLGALAALIGIWRMLVVLSLGAILVRPFLPGIGLAGLLSFASGLALALRGRRAPAAVPVAAVVSWCVAGGFVLDLLRIRSLKEWLEDPRSPGSGVLMLLPPPIRLNPLVLFFASILACRRADRREFVGEPPNRTP